MGLREGGPMLVRRLAVMDFELVPLLLDDFGAECLAREVRERRLERPVLLRSERLDLALAIDDEPERDRLNPAGGKPVAVLFPEERGHRVANETVHDAASLLRIDQVLIDLAGMLECLLDRCRGDFVESDAAEDRKSVV